MSYPISKNNSFQFEYRGDKFALGAVPDSFDAGIWTVSLFISTPGGWNSVVGGGFPIWGVDNNVIAASGSVHGYLKDVVLPMAEAYLFEQHTPQKPDFEDKGACLTYDLATGNVEFDPVTGKFTLDPPPLNHTKP